MTPFFSFRGLLPAGCPRGGFPDSRARYGGSSLQYEILGLEPIARQNAEDPLQTAADVAETLARLLVEHRGDVSVAHGFLDRRDAFLVQPLARARQRQSIDK